MGTLLSLRSFQDDGDRRPAIAPPPTQAPSRQLVRSPELGELRALCAAADLGSISRAARLLNVSQPALSKRLRGLEALAGTALLERSTCGVTLTPMGSRLYAAAYRLLEEADAVETVMSEFIYKPQTARVAASPTIADDWLPDVLVDLKLQGDQALSVELVTANSASVRQMIDEGRSDIGLAAIDPGRRVEDGLDETIIWEDELIVAVPAGHRWRTLDEIDPEDFARTAIIRPDSESNSARVIDAALEAEGLFQVAPTAEIGSAPAAIALAIATGVPVVLPLTVALGISDAQLTIRRIAGIKLERRFALLLRAGVKHLTPPARALAQHLLGWRERSEQAAATLLQDVPAAASL
jgi:DNA-binding transcriptional LysR family regulator